MSNQLNQTFETALERCVTKKYGGPVKSGILEGIMNFVASDHCPLSADEISPEEALSKYEAFVLTA